MGIFEQQTLSHLEAKKTIIQQKAARFATLPSI